MNTGTVLSSLFILLISLSSCALLPDANQDENKGLNLEPAWQSEALFDNPESVVFDPVAKILIVSNVNGPPMKKDGNGYLSKLALNGVVLDRKWLSGFDGPKGMALRGNTLYVADITSLAVVDLSSGRMQKFAAVGAKFLNDVAMDSQGRVYVSDTYTDTIYMFDGGKMEPWVRTRRLRSPNGLYIDGDTLYVGSWGVRTCGLETEELGHLLKIDLASKKISDVGADTPLANLDGVEGLGARGFLVTDWQAGTLIHLTAEAKIVEKIELGQGTADLTILPADWELVVVPMMKDNIIRAFTLPVQQ